MTTTQKMGRPVRPTSEGAVTHIGGLPSGLPNDLWPSCQSCGKKQDFLLQLDLQSPLSLAARFDWAFVFLCPDFREDCCEMPGYYNIVLLNGLTRNVAYGVSPKWPERQFTFTDYTPPDYDNEEERPSGPYLDPEGVKQLLSLPRDPEGGITLRRGDLPATPASDTLLLGGSPNWVQDEFDPRCPKCEGEMVFAAQLEAEVKLEGNDEDATLWLPFHGGAGYVFLCKEECSAHAAHFHWDPT